MAFDAPARHQFGIAHALARSRIREHTRFRLQPFGGDAEALGAHLGENRARFRRRGLQHRTELPDAQRSERAHVPRAHAGVRHHRIDRVQIDFEFLGQQLCERRLRALPQFYLAYEALDAAVGRNAQVRVEVRGVTLALLGFGGLRQEDEQSRRPGQRGEFAPCEVTCAAHRAPAFPAAA